MEQAAEDDNNTSLEQTSVSIVVAVCEYILKRNWEINNQHLGPSVDSNAEIAWTSSSYTICRHSLQIPVSSVVVPLWWARRISMQKGAKYLDDKQEDGVLHVIFAWIGSLQDTPLRSGT